MKKAIILIIILIITLPSFSQPYVTMGATNKGLTRGLGYSTPWLTAEAAYYNPVSRLDKPRFFTASFGLQKWFGKYSFVVSTGAAFVTVNDYSNYYNNDAAAVDKVRSVYSFSGVEAGWNQYLGRVFIKVEYMQGMYYGAGMRIYIIKQKTNSKE